MYQMGIQLCHRKGRPPTVFFVLWQSTITAPRSPCWWAVLKSTMLRKVVWKLVFAISSDHCILFSRAWLDEASVLKGVLFVPKIWSEWQNLCIGAYFFEIPYVHTTTSLLNDFPSCRFRHSLCFSEFKVEKIVFTVHGICFCYHVKSPCVVLEERIWNRDLLAYTYL